MIKGTMTMRKLSEDSPEVLRREVMSPSLTDVRETLYIRFSKLKPKVFKGTTDPYEAEEWLHSTQAILEAMELSDKEKIQCATFMLKKEARYWWRTVKKRIDVSTTTWEEFVIEFNLKYFNSEMVITQQTEFHNLKQGQMTVAETVRKFERLERLCQFLQLNEEERIRRMLEMFHPEIAILLKRVDYLLRWPSVTKGHSVQNSD